MSPQYFASNSELIYKTSSNYNKKAMGIWHSCYCSQYHTIVQIWVGNCSQLSFWTNSLTFWPSSFNTFCIKYRRISSKLSPKSRRKYIVWKTKSPEVSFQGSLQNKSKAIQEQLYQNKTKVGTSCLSDPFKLFAFFLWFSQFWIRFYSELIAIRPDL